MRTARDWEISCEENGRESRDCGIVRTWSRISVYVCVCLMLFLRAIRGRCANAYTKSYRALEKGRRKNERLKEVEVRGPFDLPPLVSYSSVVGILNLQSRTQRFFWSLGSGGGNETIGWDRGNNTLCKKKF